MIPRWCSTAPLGKPVVPEVYWICAAACGLTSGSARSGARLGAERLPVGERDHLAQRRQVAAYLLHHLGHRAGAVGRDQENAVGLRLAQHVCQLLRPQRGVDRHHGDPGQAGGQLQDHPFGDVVGPHRDTVPGAETAQQRPCRALGGLQQLGVAPPPPGRRVHRSLHQRGGARRLCRRVAQGVAHGKVNDRLREVGGPVRGRERHDPPRLHVIPDADAKRKAAAGLLLAILPWDQGECKTVAT